MKTFLVQVKRKDCLHCGGKGTGRYCEKCYSDLVAKNTQLQVEKKELLDCIKSFEYVREEQKKYIENLETIRECYLHDRGKQHIPKID